MLQPSGRQFWESAQSGSSPRASTPKAEGKPSDDGKPGPGGAGGKQNNGKSGSGRDLTGQEKSARGQVKKAVYLLYQTPTMGGLEQEVQDGRFLVKKLL